MLVMRSGRTATRKSITALLLAGIGMSMVPAHAAAQDDARLRKVEAELRALQRAVFPGGDGRYFTPEVDTSASPQRPATTGAPSTSTLSNMLARLDSLESQIARLTARNEESSNQIAQLEAQLEELRENSAGDEGPANFSPSSSSRTGASASIPSGGRSGVLPAPSPTPTPTPASTTNNTRSTPTAGRIAAIAAITKPSTGDAGEDDYSYGFRLWDAGFFPEAQQALTSYVQKYPKHARISYGRNLLGRAYLDNGQPREAATHFFENYQADKQGARAGDSLLYLSEAMIAIGDTNRACIALAEFGDSYQALATGRLKEQYDRTKNKVSCS